MKRYLLWSLLSIVLLCACSDEDTPIDADDNFITSVTLTTNDNSYDAVVGESDITVTVPYNVSLDGAKASFVYTPSAKIYPSPSEITNWNEERIFRVVSYNGEERQYTYRVVKDEIREEGDVVLKTESEITAFREKGTSMINGNLTIGTDNGEEITTLDGLENLKEVKGIINILESYKGTDLTGLDNLKSIGGFELGSSEKYSNVPLDYFSLNSIENIEGDVNIYDNSIVYVDFKELPVIRGSVKIASTKLKSITADKLEEVSGDFIVDCKNGDVIGGEITELSLPVTVKIGGTLSGSNFAYLETISCKNLKTVGAIIFEELPMELNRIEFPSIETVQGDMIFTSTTNYQPIGMVTSGNTSLFNLIGFEKLKEVKGTMKFRYFTELENLPNLDNLYLGGMCLDNMHKFNKIDLSKTNLHSDNSKNPIVEILNMPLNKLEGTKIMPCDFNITVTGNQELEISGIEEIGSIYLHGAISSNEFILPFKKIYGDCIFDETPAVLKAPNLTEVGGNIGCFGMSGNNDIYFPSLSKIGKQFFVVKSIYNYDFSSLKEVSVGEIGNKLNNTILSDMNSSFHSVEEFSKGYGMYLKFGQGESINFASLEKVGGNGINLIIDYWDTPIKSLNCPKLESIDETLKISASEWWPDDQLDNLYFPVLSKLPNVNITGLEALYDFSSFGTLFTNGQISNSSDWNISGCGYNPTFEDMKAGRYKPTESAIRTKSRGLSKRPSRRRVR